MCAAPHLCSSCKGLLRCSLRAEDAPCRAAVNAFAGALHCGLSGSMSLAVGPSRPPGRCHHAGEALSTQTLNSGMHGKIYQRTCNSGMPQSLCASWAVPGGVWLCTLSTLICRLLSSSRDEGCTALQRSHTLYAPDMALQLRLMLLSNDRWAWAARQSATATPAARGPLRASASRVPCSPPAMMSTSTSTVGRPSHPSWLLCVCSPMGKPWAAILLAHQYHPLQQRHE